MLYKTIRAGDSRDLDIAVNKALAVGWILNGGASVGMSQNTAFGAGLMSYEYIQAVTKEDK